MRELPSIIICGKSAEIEMIQVPAGQFMMGSSCVFFGESPEHSVTLPNDFLLGRYLVTQAQWMTVMGSNPSKLALSQKNPVDCVSWIQAVEFCERLSQESDYRFRLPTESEWEYACRAGSLGDFFFENGGTYGDSSEIPSEAARCLSDYAWFDLNSQGRSHAIGQKTANPWGFYDMVGNLWEWCEDWWHDDYQRAPKDGSAWVRGASGQLRVLRGGAWDMDAFRCRSTYRSYDYPDQGTDRFGLRIAASI